MSGQDIEYLDARDDAIGVDAATKATLSEEDLEVEEAPGKKWNIGGVGIYQRTR